ncbi:MAG: polyprenyl synthetase family protein [Acidimicrobiia bacterium]|nr:polyprenyl synthetase family protein [Acidimicrobiia bacterium]
MDSPILQDLVPIDRVWRRMAAVERRLIEATTSEDAFLTQIAQHGLAAGGKRYRPLLAQVAAELGDRDNNEPIEAGVAVELVHLGSLYHDDVIDEADTRRGAVSVNENWTNTVAILAGDFLLARASEVAAPLGTEAVALIARTYATLCEGQVLELQLTNDLDHGRDEYYAVIGGKTASLIRTSARLGAMTGGADRETIEAISDWAWEMGLVFQLADDVLDFVASEEWLGKPAGSDIGEGTFTLPLLYAADGPDGVEIRARLADGMPYDRADIDRVIELVIGGGYIDRVLDEATERMRASEKAAARIPENELTPIIRNLDRYLLDRVEVARSQA